MSTILNKAAVIGDGDEGLSVTGRVKKEEILEVKLQANKDSKADRWELAICEAREELVRVFTDRSMKLAEVVEEVRKRREGLGPDTVRFAWVKVHIGTQGDEKAEQTANPEQSWGDEEEGKKVIMEGI